MDRGTYRQMDGQWMDGLVTGCMYRRIDKQMFGWTNGWSDGQTDRQEKR
jgi:hypothetical protein